MKPHGDDFAPVGADVLIDLPLIHLGEPFVYHVPDEMGDAVALGVRVRVPFGGRRRVGGFVVGLGARVPEGARDLLRVVSPLPALDVELLWLGHWLAERYAGAVADALHLVLPPRVAAVEPEFEPWPPEPVAARVEAGGGAFDDTGDGAPVVSVVGTGAPATVFWRPLVGRPTAPAVVEMVAATLARGRGAIVVLPEVAAGSTLADALRQRFPDAADVSAAVGERRRYRTWLEVRAGRRRLVIGGRSAVLAPVADLGLVVVDDETNVAHKEQRSPRYHAREVAIARGRRSGAVVVLTGFLPSAEVVALLRAGHCELVAPERARERAAAPLVEVVDPDDEGPAAGRIHPRALAALRAALERDESAFVLVPRRGAADPQEPRVRSTGQVAAELRGRLPAARIWRLDRAVLEAGATPPWEGAGSGIVVGTLAGAKERPPIARCRTVIVLGADAALNKAEVVGAEEGLRSWSRVAAWCGPRGTPGRMVLQARDGNHHAVQALVRWDPDVFWRRELPRRTALGFPPARRLILVEGVVDGEADAVRASLQQALGTGADLLGPAPLGRGWRIVAKVRDAADAARRLRPVLADASRHGAPLLSVDVEPLEILRAPRAGAGAAPAATDRPGGAVPD